MKIEDLLQRVVKEGASDGFIAAGAAPAIKVDGEIYPISEQDRKSTRLNSSH